MKFRCIVDKKNRIRTPAPTGDKVTIVKGWIYIDGEYVYTEKKRHAHYEETQAAKDSVDLKKIIERYKAGDDSALDRVNGFYLDTVTLPKTLGELYDAWSNAQAIFEAMPSEIKEKYNNNPATFYKNYGTEGFDKFMNDYRASLGAQNDTLEKVNTANEMQQHEINTANEMQQPEIKVGENNVPESE